MGERDPWPLALYAPGNYLCKCAACGKQFEGDKRAHHCLECAVVRMKQALAQAERELNELRKGAKP